MDNSNLYVKLSGIDEFTLKEYQGYIWFKWDQVTSKPQKSAGYFEGAKKQFILLTEKGVLNVSQSQMSQILLAAFIGGKSEPVGRTFTVKTNGKQGMDLRYFIDLKNGKAIEQTEIDMESIPF